MSENHDENANEPPPSDGNKLVPANTAAEGQSSGPDGQSGEELRVSSKREILYKLDQLPGLVVTGLLPPARANSMRSIYEAMLRNLIDSSPSDTAAIANDDLVAILRTQPHLLKVLKPFLTPEQIDLIIREAPMISSPQMNFARRLVYLNKQLINFDGRPYLPAIYASTARNLVLRASRQVEKSTFLVNTILYLAVTRPGIQILHICPRQEQARLFSRNRVIPMLACSPILSQRLADDKPGRLPVTNLQFANGSTLFVRSAFRTADAVRGVSADVLLIDECQDVAAGDLPVLKETLSHAEAGRTILCGTPKLIDNHLEAMFNQSTANEWQVACPGCGYDVILNEKCIGPTGIMCPKCLALLDKQAGHWVPRNPTATWGDGYWINALMVPWKHNHDEILESQRTYDVARFRNEVLGLPVSLGAHIVTKEQLEACCTNTPMARNIEDVPVKFRNQIVVGVDWGGGGAARTAVAVGFVRPEGTFEICHFSQISGREDPELVKQFVIEICRKFRAHWIAADGLGNGSFYNRQLLDGIGYNAHLYALLYSATGSQPYEEGILWKWPIGRTSSIGYLFSCVHKKKILFPRSSDCGTYLDEFACEVAEYDDKNRCIKYTHAETQPDDLMHAVNYALQISTRGFPEIAQSYDE